MPAMARLETKSTSDSVEHLKQVACRLFAERGVDGVTVRQIAEAAGQKNHAAVGYHFGSKEHLIRELVLDGAMLIEERRDAWLSALETKGAPASTREVIDILVRAAIEPPALGLADSYNRFIVMLAMTHRAFFMEVLGTQWNASYLRCLEHLRRLMPDMPAANKTQRFRFMGAMMGSVLAARDEELWGEAQQYTSHAPDWSSAHTITHLVQMMEAIIMAPYEGDAGTSFSIS
tara:strand:+ start:1954 stop:2649 length:696 start_codon:yes stop_codon:yes gene_type:complete